MLTNPKDPELERKADALDWLERNLASEELELSEGKLEFGWESLGLGGGYRAMLLEAIARKIAEEKQD